MDMRYLTRNVNEGFSGGEKKRNEILQARPPLYTRSAGQPAIPDAHSRDGTWPDGALRPQLAVLEAEMAILDEIDSGLDIDALRDVSMAVNGLRKPDRAVLMITHYQARPRSHFCPPRSPLRMKRVVGMQPCKVLTRRLLCLRSGCWTTLSRTLYTS